MADSIYSKVDEYGFQRGEDFDYRVYGIFMSEYIRTLTRRAQRWNVVFKDNKFKRSGILKRFIRKGIPADLRTICWMTVSGAERLKNESQLNYQLLKLKYSHQVIEVIQIDLPRTFPDNIYFANNEGYSDMLYNILSVFAHQNSEVGYCQGLNYIAGLLLLATKHEMVTFWLLKTLVEEILPKYYIRTMTGLLTDFDVLNEIVQKYEPQIHRHIQNIGMPWAMGTTKWFICIYADVLPTETVLRVWDCLFYEGSKILLRVALALIRIHKEAILQTSDLSELMSVFKNMKNHPRVIDCHGFIRDIFNLSSKLSSNRIEKLRLKHQK
ncbi:growth hormone-regulated TBC protein 1-A [Sitophilus oryzae]|uniref:Growth hormone-regulated TBC protein 1 n=1 Tax=Sitophilus oryzae TaxID=7048 RepID=A0A6J2X9G1_SITOR|nr:growth hormone-regulated TBC protein 1-A [Sitophilus oryzae]